MPGSIDILVGGSPCQPCEFNPLPSLNQHQIQDCTLTQLSLHTDSLLNTANNSKDGFEADKRTETVFEFLDVLEHLSPPFFCLENVPAFLSGSAHRPSPAPRVVARLLRLGYQCRAFIANTAHYNIPQSRHRVFFVAAKHGYHLPSPPPPTTHFSQKAGTGSIDFGSLFILSNTVGLKPPVTISDSISDLNWLPGDKNWKADVKHADDEDESDTSLMVQRLRKFGDHILTYEKLPTNRFQQAIRQAPERTENSIVPPSVSRIGDVLCNHWAEASAHVSATWKPAIDGGQSIFNTIVGKHDGT